MTDYRQLEDIKHGEKLKLVGYLYNSFLLRLPKNTPTDQVCTALAEVISTNKNIDLQEITITDKPSKGYQSKTVVKVKFNYFVYNPDAIYKVETNLLLENNSKKIIPSKKVSDFQIEVISKAQKAKQETVENYQHEAKILIGKLYREVKPLTSKSQQILESIHTNDNIEIIVSNFIELLSNIEKYLSPEAAREVENDPQFVDSIKCHIPHLKRISKSPNTSKEWVRACNFLCMIKIFDFIDFINKVEQTDLNLIKIDPNHQRLLYPRELFRLILVPTTINKAIKKEEDWIQKLLDKRDFREALHKLSNKNYQPQVGNCYTLCRVLEFAAFSLSIESLEQANKANFLNLDILEYPNFSAEELSSIYFWIHSIYSTFLGIKSTSESKKILREVLDNFKADNSLFLLANLQLIFQLELPKLKQEKDDSLTRGQRCTSQLKDVFSSCSDLVEFDFKISDKATMELIESRPAQISKFAQLVAENQGNIGAMLQNCPPGGDLEKLVNTDTYTFRINRGNRLTFRYDEARNKIVILSIVGHT
ncbi:MAG: hypothetical protein WCK98_03845 [bacterium]